MKYQFIIVILHFSHIFGNHYEILGISRSSTDFDIKKAYKKLARIWHPDKSKLPEANEKFMQINEAYEVLSDPEKRKEYDAFGTVSNEPRGNDGFHRGTFWHSNFGSTFFQTEEDTRDTRFETVDFRHFKMNIVPDSIRKPSLILLVTHFCVACHHAMRLWGNIADQVSDSGIRMGISDVMRDSRLREELKVHHVPSVIFIIDGQSKYMQADISKETIIEFLRQSFPRDLITFIYSEEDLNRFHGSWMKDSRSKMLMTKPLDRASFRYLSLAYKYRDKISAGFIHLDETNKYPLRNIVDAYRLDYDEETLLIFHDEKQSYNKMILPKPVTQIAKSRLSINEMEYLIEANNQLPLSRLLSQSVFDRSCPPPSQKHQSFGFCVIAVVHSKHGSNLSEAENWQYLRSLVDDRNRGKMLYLYGDVQFEFLKSLQLFDQSTIVDVNVFIDQVILLWRQSYESAASIFLSNPWEYPNLDWVLTNWNLLSNLDTAVPILKTKHRMQSKLADSESLTELVDELASPLIWRILARFISYIHQIITFLYENLLDPFTIIIIVLALVLLSYSYSTMKSVSQHLSEENEIRSRKTKPSNTGKGSIFKHVQELTNMHYNRLLTNSQKGNLVVVMFTTDLTPSKPVEIMVNAISQFKCHIPIEPLYLRLDTYKNWPSSILGLISVQEDQKQAIATISSLSNNRPVSEEGIVLALNIIRCYLYICPINMLRDSPFPYKKNDESHFRKRNLRNATYYLDSDSSESEEPVVSLDKKDSLENKFCDWLCQLTDGTCKRYHLKQWPGHL